MDIQQFLAKYAKPAPQGDCLLWQKSGLARGYGTLTINGRKQLAHRRAYELANGPIPPGMVVRHRCDTPACVNPKHLDIGTQADNMADSVAKGRHGSQASPMLRHGQNNGMAKLTEAEVIAIRSDPRPIRALAKLYGVGKSSISNIKSGKTWFRV